MLRPDNEVESETDKGANGEVHHVDDGPEANDYSSSIQLPEMSRESTYV